MIGKDMSKHKMYIKMTYDSLALDFGHLLQPREMPTKVFPKNSTLSSIASSELPVERFCEDFPTILGDNITMSHNNLIKVPL